MMRRNLLRICGAVSLLSMSGCTSNSDREEDTSESENKSSGPVPVDGPEEDENDYEGTSTTAGPSGISVWNRTDDEIMVSLTILYKPDDDIIFENEVTLPEGGLDSVARDELTKQGSYNVSVQTLDFEESYEWKAGSGHSLQIIVSPDEVRFRESMP